MIIRKLGELSLADRDWAGGKAWVLGQLSQSGFCVPPGFVVSRSEELINHDALMQAFDSLESDTVAVRSSATGEDSHTHSFAGQFETTLSVRREDLLPAIKRCFESVALQRVQAYGHVTGHNLSGLKMAVLVQRQVASLVSGVAFSAHPVTRERRQVVVEAVWGLGTALVAGEVTPDTFIVRKDDFTLEAASIASQRLMWRAISGGGVAQEEPDANVRSKAKLTHAMLTAVARLCVDVERYLEMPVDIEWAVDEHSRTWLLQARPITA